MSCSFCGSSSRPSVAIGPDMSLVEACADCGKPLTGGFAQVLEQTQTALQQASKESLRPAQQPVQQAPTDILSLTKLRAAQLESEIASLEAKRRELDMLRRMLAAAEPLN